MQVLIFWGGFHAQIQTRFWNIITTVTMSIFYDDLDALIYVFFIIHYMRKHVPTAIIKNDTALLLITKIRKNVAAVIFRQIFDFIIFYYAKNHFCENSLSDYLSNIKRIIAINNHLNEMQTGLAFEIINFCVKKWRSRAGLKPPMMRQNKKQWLVIPEGNGHGISNSAALVLSVATVFKTYL